VRFAAGLLAGKFKVNKQLS
jgi:hypothetical protein